MPTVKPDSAMKILRTRDIFENEDVLLSGGLKVKVSENDTDGTNCCVIVHHTLLPFYTALSNFIVRGNNTNKSIGLIKDKN